MTEKTMSDFYDYICLHYRHRPALICDQTRYSFGDIELNGRKLANAISELGIRAGDNIAVLMPNCPEIVFIDYACSKLGIITTPLAAYLKADDILYILQDTQAKTVIYHESFQECITEVRKKLSDDNRLFICDAEDLSNSSEKMTLKQLFSRGSQNEPECQVKPDDIYLIIYSGGTTGKPKGIVHSHRTWTETLVIIMMEMDVARKEIFVAVTPLTHGARTFMFPVLMLGGSCVIRRQFQPKDFLKTVENEKGTTTFMVPTMINSLLKFPELDNYDISSLRNILYGAAPISPDLLKEAIRRFGQILTQAYGQTESPTAISFLSKDDHVIDGDERDEQRLASCGRPSILLDVKLVDDDGNEVQDGDAGEIIVKSPNNMVGYLNNPELTQKTVIDGWVYTGDIAKKDEEGYLYIFDRKKDMIVSGGFNVFPTEIENTLLQHSKVRSVAVIGVPDDKWGEAVKAVVVLEEGQSVLEDELIAFCKEKKGSIQAPKSIDFVESIPYTPLGKIDKGEIRKRYWEGMDRKI